MASRIVTLFSEQKIAQAGSPSMVASVVAHFLTIGAFFVLVKVAVPHVVHVPPQEFSVVRILTYQPQREEAQSGSGGLHYQAKNSPSSRSAGGTPRPRQRVLPPNPKIKTGNQTILQAHAIKIPPPTHAVIPTVLLTAAHPKITEQIFTSPPHPTPAAPTPRLLTLPNAETHVADIMLSSTAFATSHMALPPSTTVPYQLNHPTDDAQIVETSSPTKQAPTPTRLLTISDLKLIQGTIAIPQSENEIQKNSARGSLAPGEESHTPGAGMGIQPGTSLLRATLSGSGTTGQPSKASTWTAASHSTQDPSGLSTSAGNLSAQALAGSGNGQQLSFTHLSQSRLGHFGAVLLGDSPEQDYPETADLWVGRDAYTVYVNVGTSTSWILQYSLPKSATTAQLRATLKAPYPYAMLRPNFPASELNADALLVHGFINTNGNLVHLSVEFPPDFSLAARILKALSQWQFRPASLDGAATEVEVLLIIPNGQNAH